LSQAGIQINKADSCFPKAKAAAGRSQPSWVWSDNAVHSAKTPNRSAAPINGLCIDRGLTRSGLGLGSVRLR